MRVLVLASTFPRWPGDEQPAFILDFCRNLPDCEVHVLAPGAAGAADHEVIDGIRVHRFRYAPFARWQRLAYGGGMLANVRDTPALLLLLPAFLVAMLFAAWRLARRERVNIVHAHWIIPQGLAGAVLRRLLPRCPPLVVTSHGADAYAFSGRVGRWLKQLILRRADACTAVSSQLANDLQAQLSLATPPAVAPMGIDLSRFRPAEGQREHRFCFVGRFVEKKGIADLVEAYGRAVARGGDTVPALLLVGDGPLRPAIESRIAAAGLAGRVHLAGWQPGDAVAAAMARSLAVIVPSVVARSGDREGLGLVAVEAIAAGTPVIAYDYGAIRDVVEPGIDGLLVTQGDIDGLAQAFLDAAAGQLPSVSDASRARIHRRFGWPAVGENYRALYARLASGHTR